MLFLKCHVCVTILCFVHSSGLYSCGAAYTLSIGNSICVWIFIFVTFTTEIFVLMIFLITLLVTIIITHA